MSGHEVWVVEIGYQERAFQLYLFPGAFLFTSWSTMI